MAKLLFISTHGSEQPTRASLPLVLAKAAIEEGHQVQITFAGDAAVNVRETVAENIHGMGFPPFRELMAFLVDRHAEFFV